MTQCMWEVSSYSTGLPTLLKTCQKFRPLVIFSIHFFLPQAELFLTNIFDSHWSFDNLSNHFVTLLSPPYKCPAHTINFLHFFIKS